MSEPTIDNLARRLERVERENRRLKRVGVVALALIAGVVLVGQATPSNLAKKVKAEAFVLYDSTGNLRAQLSVNPEGVVHGSLIDMHIQPQFSVGLLPDGSVTLDLGKRLSLASLGDDSAAALMVNGKNGKPRVGIGIGPDDVPFLRVMNKAGKVIWSAP